MAAGVSFLTGIGSLPGQPGYDPAKHRYFYDNGGTLIPATHVGYLHAVAAQNRLFLGVTLVFTWAAAAIAWGERSRRRNLVTPARWRRRPKIPLLACALALAAAAGLAGSAACAVLLVGRVDAYDTSGPYLRAGQPVQVLLAPDDYVVFVGCTQDINRGGDRAGGAGLAPRVREAGSPGSAGPGRTGGGLRSAGQGGDALAGGQAVGGRLLGRGQRAGTARAQPQERQRP